MKMFQNTIKQFCSILITSKCFGVTFALLLTQHSKFNQASIYIYQLSEFRVCSIWIFYFTEYDQSTEHSTMRPCPDVTSCNQIQFSRCHDEKLMSARGLLYSFQNFNNFNPFTETFYVFILTFLNVWLDLWSQRYQPYMIYYYIISLQQTESSIFLI